MPVPNSLSRFSLCIAVLLSVISPKVGWAASEDGCDHELVVPATATIEIDHDETYDCVTVEYGGSLIIDPGCTLTISCSDGFTCNGDTFTQGTLALAGGGKATVNGCVYFSDSQAVLLVSSKSCWLYGTGQVVGYATGAKILIQRGTTLTSSVGICGCMAIAPTGLLGIAGFCNKGSVVGDGGVLSLFGLAITDTSTARWQAMRSPGVGYGTLRFNVSALALSGQFGVYDGAELDLNKPVATTGVLDYTTGSITVALLAMFKYGGDNCSSSHTAPPSPIVGPAAESLNCP